jgi:HlyD family secretion protein
MTMAAKVPTAAEATPNAVDRPKETVPSLGRLGHLASYEHNALGFAADLDSLRQQSANWISLRRNLKLGMVGVAVLFFGGFGAMSTVAVDGAVITGGMLVVETSTKKIQHPQGGVVAGVYVKDGDRVDANQLLLRLDDTVAKANLAIINKALVQAQARAARLEHEIADRPALVYPQSLLDKRSDPDALEAMEAETRLFDVRRVTRISDKARLSERLGQLRQQIGGLNAQITAKDREIELIFKELQGVRELYAKKLVPIQRLTQLERDTTRLQGERAQLVSAIAQTEGKLTETQLEISGLDNKFLSDAAADRQTNTAKMQELSERQVSAAETLLRIEIRAPQAGVVHQLFTHTIGGVVAPTDVLMLIVPEHDRLVAEVRIATSNIDQVYPGQPATVRFTAFDRTITPTVSSKLIYISADTSFDQRTNGYFYSARLELSDSELNKLAGLKLVPGMPVEAYIRTGERTLVSYVFKPLVDQAMRTFRN